MSEIAEDMINGACCSLCGCYFEAEHGYPVVCIPCYTDWEDNVVMEQLPYPPSLHDML